MCIRDRAAADFGDIAAGMLEDLGVPCSSGIAMFIIVLVLSFFMLALSLIHI